MPRGNKAAALKVKKGKGKDNVVEEDIFTYNDSGMISGAIVHVTLYCSDAIACII